MKGFEYGIGLAHLKYFHSIKFLDSHETEYHIPLYDLVFHFHCGSLSSTPTIVQKQGIIMLYHRSFHHLLIHPIDAIRTV